MCWLNSPACREHLKLASLAVDKVASIQYGMQAAGGQDVLDAFVDVELTVALTAYGELRRQDGLSEQLGTRKCVTLQC